MLLIAEFEMRALWNTLEFQSFSSCRTLFNAVSVEVRGFVCRTRDRRPVTLPERCDRCLISRKLNFEDDLGGEAAGVASLILDKLVGKSLGGSSWCAGH